MKKRFRDEFAGAVLGDARRSERLVELGVALGVFPGASLPEALGDGAALEAGYRFLGNESVEAEKLLAPHARETGARCARRGSVVVAHDTTDFTFSGSRRGLGRIRGTKERGFLAHVSLAVARDEWREPLGVPHVETWVRGDESTRKIRGESTKKSSYQRRRDPDRESKRWSRGVEAVERQLDGCRAIHVMDREADAYDLLAMLVAARCSFVIRSNFDRKVADGAFLSDAVDKPTIVVEREVPLSARKRAPFSQQRRTYPPRTARTATLGIKAVTVELARPHGLPQTLPKKLRVNVVEVEEINTPSGEPPVTWRLYTTEPIGSAADLERIVDDYRCRWCIEEFFKALKTGCAIEKRQLETYHSLENALAIYIPIAWRMLRHRSLARLDEHRPASEILTSLQLKILRRLRTTKLSRTITLSEALLAIAGLGGHLQRNGPPGWITIGRGYERLLALEEGAQLAAEM
jgi:hypothetical protein